MESPDEALRINILCSQYEKKLSAEDSKMVKKKKVGAAANKGIIGQINENDLDKIISSSCSSKDPEKSKAQVDFEGVELNPPPKGTTQRGHIANGIDFDSSTY